MDLRQFAPALALLANGAFAQALTNLDRVEIIGSRLPRVDAETALPVQIIRREEIERSGAMNAEELLERISANFGGQREATGLDFPDTLGFSGASLRGFGSGETLVLLNGRRLANYAFTSIGGSGVDLHVIPLAAIERVEVLKDGASALYGSDAIAGVINFVTRQDYAGIEAGLSYRAPEARGGGERARATLALGHGNLESDGYNLLGFVDVQRSERLRAIDRSFAATGNRPELGLQVASPGSWPANIRRPGGPGALLNPAAPDCTPLTVNRGKACWFDFAQTLDLLPASRQANLLGRGTLRLTPDTEVYAELLAATSRIRYVGTATPVASLTTQTGTSFTLPESSPYYPTNLGLSGDLSLAYRTVPLGGRISDVESDNARALAGLKSRWAGWEFDGALSANYSRARQRYLSGYVDAGRLSDAMATGSINPFGPSAPEGEALLASTQLQGPARRASGRTVQADLRASRELVDLPGGPLALATGVEARYERLEDEQYPIVADVVGGTPAAPKEASRNAQAAYLELVAPVATGLEIQAAARLDRYSDFGTELSPKIALRFQPTHWWLARASVGRGFRAPSLPELYTQQSTGYFELGAAGVSDPVRCPETNLDSDCAPEVLTVSGGNPALQPQRSTQTSAGMVLEPAPGWQASVDVWSIRVEDIIGVLPFDDVIFNIPRYDGRNVVRGPVDPDYPDLPGPIVRIETLNENLGDWRVDGADLSLSTPPVPTAVGRFAAQFNGTYIHKARQSIFEGNDVNLIGRAAPRWQHTLSFYLDQGPWKTTLSQRYRSGYQQESLLPDGSTRRVESTRLWDAQLVYAMTRELQWTLGVRNLLDTDPPFDADATSFQVGYNAGVADPLGRTWTIGLRIAWP